MSVASLAFLRTRAGWVALAVGAAVLTGCDGGTPVAAPPPVAVSAPSAAAASPGPAASRSAAPRCERFPADNVWRAPVAGLPVHRSSAAYVASIGADRPVHADFGSGTWDGGPIGIPVTTVARGQAGVKVSFEYAGESDRVAYPIPAGARIEGGPGADGDRHVILYDPSACRVYELYRAFPGAKGTWRAGSGAVFDLRTNRLRPAGWTSADAAGLSIFAGLVRYDEVAAGHVDHAIRVTVPRTRAGYVWPARHQASDLTDPALPSMGLRLRLRAGVDVSKLPRQARIVATAMQRYGVIVADNGSAWYISGDPDERWDNDALAALGRLRGRDFEAVDTTSLMISKDSAAVR